jgi:putative transposase
MIVEIKAGIQLIARGKLATVREAVDHNSLKVVFSSTGESAVVELTEVEFLRNSSEDENTTDGDRVTVLPSNLSKAELERAGVRFDVIRKWKSGEWSRAKAASELGLSENHLYKIAKNYQEELGSLSVLDNKRGRKAGALMLPEQIERIITKAIKKVYKTRAATFSKVWSEVDITCAELGLIAPAKQAVTHRVKAKLSEAERDRIKLGADAANQKHAPRPGRKMIKRPLGWVQIDHTLVDILLLANDRLHIIGRPWLTVVIDVFTRVVLGYYLSLHVPSALSVACALTHAVLRKDDFVKNLGLGADDYPYFGVPSVLHMDNASEFTSSKLKNGCHLFGIDPKYRPFGRKHFGGHVERWIGTFMTTKVHFLKGTTMSNAVARRNLDSEKGASMTFQEFSRWFAREVVVYHATVHEQLKTSPRKAWLDFFAPTGGFPFPPQVTDPHQFKLFFMPEKSRKIHPHGIEFMGEHYWDPVLTPFVGTNNVVIKYDPYNLRQIWVKIEGLFYPVGLSDLTLMGFSYEEYRASLYFKEPIRAGSLTDASAINAYREKQAIEIESAKLTKAERRRRSAAEAYRSAYPSVITSHDERERPEKPDYTRPPKKFNSEE